MESFGEGVFSVGPGCCVGAEFAGIGSWGIGNLMCFFCFVRYLLSLCRVLR